MPLWRAGSGPYPIFRAKTAGAIRAGAQSLCRPLTTKCAAIFVVHRQSFNCMNRRRVQFSSCAAETGHTGRFLVRERDEQIKRVPPRNWPRIFVVNGTAQALRPGTDCSGSSLRGESGRSAYRLGHRG